MIVLHAGIDHEGVFLWGETQPFAAALPRSLPRTLPTAAAAADVADAASRCHLSASGTACERILWLPTWRNNAVPSHRLLGQAAASGEPTLQRWRVPGVLMRVADVVDLLCRARANALLCPGIMAAEDLRFLMSPLSFAASLVARQQFLPGLRRREAGRWQAIWEPVIAGDDFDRFTAIASALPDACRSISAEGSSGSEGTTSRVQAVYQLVGLCVDAFVRRGVRAAGSDSKGAPPVVAQRGLPCAHIQDRWLNALHSADGVVDGTEDELNKLRAELARWKRPIDSLLGAPFRLCFRLEEPRLLELQEVPEVGVIQATDEPWRLSFFLQSKSDPSLLIPAEQIWSGRQLPPTIAATIDGARRYVLAALGTAAGIYSALESSLLSPDPVGVSLDLDAAYQFLNEEAGLLKQSGFGVLLPAWWGRRRRRLTASAGRVESRLQPGDGKLNLDTVLDFRWSVALGDQKMTRQELEELARLKVPLVRVRGQWIELTPEEIKAALSLTASGGKQAVSLRDFIRLVVGAAELPGGIDFAGIESGGATAELLERLRNDHALQPQAPPPQFQGELRPYQARGYAWLDFLTGLGLGACLADDMGLGKTVQTLALLEKVWHEQRAEQRQPVLLVCPTSVLANWQKEAQRFTPDLPVLVHHGAKRRKKSSFAEAIADKAIVVSSYALLARDRDFLSQVEWSGIILDEAQNVKNPQTKVAQAARALPAAFKIALTGTPVENHVGDLWSIMEFLNPGLLGNASQFRRNFLLPIQVQQDKEALSRLQQITQPFVLRRLKTDKSIIADLPEKLEMKDYCHLTREQVTLYQAVVRELDEKLKNAEAEIERKGLVLATLSRLKQICDHPALFLHDRSALDHRSGKLSRLREMLEECLQIGDRALIFTQFAEMGEMMQQYLVDRLAREVLFLHGGTTKTRRQQMIERFQTSDGPPIFILSLKAGGVGLNLTQANQVIHFDRWWNPAVENQATDRAFRIGQQRNVQVHKFICAGTLEEKIDDIIEGKGRLAQSIVGSGEGWLSRLNNAELRQVLQLSKDVSTGD